MKHASKVNSVVFIPLISSLVLGRRARSGKYIKTNSETKFMNNTVLGGDSTLTSCVVFLIKRFLKHHLETDPTPHQEPWGSRIIFIIVLLQSRKQETQFSAVNTKLTSEFLTQTRLKESRHPKGF